MPNTAPEDFVKVIVGVIEDSNANILLARRPSHLHQGDKWEFPGGKIESGELSHDALNRELHEELGITVSAATPLIRVPFHYDDKSVSLDVWRVQEYSGEPVGREGQAIRWLPKKDLAQVDFPAANQAIVAALTLSPIYAISTVAKYGEEKFLNILENALDKGLKLLQLREHQLEHDVFVGLANKVIDRCHQHKAKVLLNCDPEWVVSTAADGVHLTQDRLLATDRRPLTSDHLIAASCHDEQTLLHAQKLGLDFVVVSPVQKTPTHPDKIPLGWEIFQQLCAVTSLPVFALGGMTLSGVAHARQYGAQGVAMLSALWEADNQELRRHL